MTFDLIKSCKALGEKIYNESTIVFKISLLSAIPLCDGMLFIRTVYLQYNKLFVASDSY